jgi:hypothetical protein
LEVLNAGIVGGRVKRWMKLGGGELIEVFHGFVEKWFIKK